MAFSYTRLLLTDTEIKIYYRGLDYARNQKVNITRTVNNACYATAKGQKTYDIWLGFSRVGSLKQTCSCPYFLENKKTICKHIIATSVLWDRLRNVSDLDEKTVKELSIPEPIITRKDITKAYNDPLHADLEVLRRAADEIGWSRPHVRLPLKPKVCDKKLLDFLDVKKGMSELKAWSRKYRYNMYFCAGEMVAGFCELIRWVKPNLKNISFIEQVKIASLLIEFNKELIMGTIDDSDGLHIFTENHLVDLLAEIGKEKVNEENKKEIARLLVKITDY